MLVGKPTARLAVAKTALIAYLLAFFASVRVQYFVAYFVGGGRPVSFGGKSLSSRKHSSLSATQVAAQNALQTLGSV